MPKSPEIITVAHGDAQHPRHGGADMIELKDGSIFMAKMLVYSSGLKQQAGDDAPADIVKLVSRDGGRTWSTPEVWLKPPPGDTAAYNPGFTRLKQGGILFRYDMYHRFVQDEPTCVSAYACVSHDECKTFSKPTTIWSRSPNHFGSQNDLRQLSTGRIVVAAMHIEGVALQDDGKGLSPTNICRAGCFYSDDGGLSWSVCESYVYLPMRGSMEPKIEELKDGRLLMVMRTQLGSVFCSHSEDGGRNWSRAQTTGLHAPESCPALTCIPQTGDLLLIWNHSPYDPQFDHYGKRTPLTIAISKNDGLTWDKVKNVETDPGWEFTNPSVIVTSTERILIAYEASRYDNLVPPGRLGRSCMDLKLAIVDLGWLYA